jgi:peptidoglycan/LPS O-acetylase OafA/YrhL
LTTPAPAGEPREAPRAGSERLASIQMLRAFAALFVVTLHAYTRIHHAFPSPSPSLFAPFAMSGAAGVDLFFVLSGYIMVRVHYDDFGKGRVRRFLARRFIRVAPLYWVLTTVALAAVLSVPGVAASFGAPDIAWVAGSYLFFPVHHLPLDGKPLIAVGWTLSYEMVFYLALAVGLTLQRKRAVALIGLLFAGSALAGALTPPKPPWLAELTSPLLIEFLLGAAIALVQRAFGDRWRGAHLAGMALGALLLIAGFPTGSHEALPDRLLVWGLPCALIVNGVCRLAPRAGNAAARLAVTLGDASYSIYLIQVFTQPLAQMMLVRLGLARLLPTDAMVALLILTTAAAGWLTWRLIERPITRRLQAGLTSAAFRGGHAPVGSAPDDGRAHRRRCEADPDPDPDPDQGLVKSGNPR